MADSIERTTSEAITSCLGAAGRLADLCVEDESATWTKDKPAMLTYIHLCIVCLLNKLPDLWAHYVPGRSDLLLVELGKLKEAIARTERIIAVREDDRQSPEREAVLSNIL